MALDAQGYSTPNDIVLGGQTLSPMTSPYNSADSLAAWQMSQLQAQKSTASPSNVFDTALADLLARASRINPNTPAADKATGGSSMSTSGATVPYALYKMQQDAAAGAAKASQAAVKATWDKYLAIANGNVDTAKMLFTEFSNQAAVRGAQEEQWAAQRAEADMLKLKSSSQYQMASQYLTESFQAGVPEYMAREYANRLRAAQAGRGFEAGGAPSQDEASLLTNMAGTNRAALLPQLTAMAKGEVEGQQDYAGKYMAMAKTGADISSQQLLSQAQAYQLQMQSALQQNATLASLFGTGLNQMQYASDTNPFYNPIAETKKKLSVTPHSRAVQGGGYSISGV